MALPFDPRAASLYGQFIQAAYTMYNADPNNLTPEPSGDFPDGYRLVAWLQMKDFLLDTTTVRFYGYVAQNAQTASQYVIAIRGTSNWVEWVDDIYALGKTPFRIAGCGMVAEGFARIYDTIQVVERPSAAPAAALAARPAPASGSFAQQVSALIGRRPAREALGEPELAGPVPQSSSVEIAGHSLGAALATLYTMENAHTEQISNPMLCTFASPLVGDATFASAFNQLDLTSWRVDNVLDVVTKVPPEILGFVHVNTVETVNSAWKVTPNPGCWHSLATYLSLIDPAKQPDPDCQLKPASPRILAPAGVAGAVSVFRPVAIDLYEGDDVDDTPGPLGGFTRVKAMGIAFLLHKATEGVSRVDRRYAARRAAWMKGPPVRVTDIDGTVLSLAPRFAAYHFLHGQDPEAEARFFLETAKLQPGDDAVVDWERSPAGTTPSADAVDRFCKVVEDKLGFPIIVYSGNVAKDLLHGKDPRFVRRRLWLAQYSDHFTVQETWDFPFLWQDNGDDAGPGPHTIAGINGLCDNSTIAPQMTVKRLFDEWGGGKQPVLQPSAPTIVWDATLYAEPTAFAGTPRKIARYGWKPDLPDPRDYSYAVTDALQKASLAVDLRDKCPPVYQQGDIGSCTANAIAAALEFDMMKQKQRVYTPSRLFIYYNERKMEGTVSSDAGAYIRDGIKSVASLGDCPESMWPYDDTPALQPSNVFPPHARAATPPTKACYDNAFHHRALKYLSIDQNLADMKDCLAAGYPFVFGFTVFPSFESQQVASTGMVPMPGADETTIGGHAVMAVGYNDETQRFIVRNSWGDGWGDKGYCFMPYAYLLDDNLADNFWTIRTVEG